MNAKTEKRLGVLAALLLTAAIFVAPNPIQQQAKTHLLSVSEEVMKDISGLVVVAHNSLTGKTIR